MVAEFDKRRKIVVEELNRLPGVSCITPKGAFYAFPNISGPASRRRSSPRGSSRRPASPPSAAPTSASSARAISASPTPTRPRTSGARSPAWANSWRGRRRRWCTHIHLVGAGEQRRYRAAFLNHALATSQPPS